MTGDVTIGGPADSWGMRFPSDPKLIPCQRLLDEVAPPATNGAMDMFCEPPKGTVNFLAFRNVLYEFDYNNLASVK